MKFERGQDVKTALDIGLGAQIKKDITRVLPTIMPKYVFEFRSPELAKIIGYEIKALTGHEVKIKFQGKNPLDAEELIVIIKNPGLLKPITIKALFEW